jgi:hypothetical protein
MSAYDPRSDLQPFGKRRTLIVLGRAKEGGPDRISGDLVLAFFSKETNFRNVLGDQGHARGLGQINDRWWSHLLAQMKGCEPGTYSAVSPSCAPAGLVPRLTDSVRGLVTILGGYIADAERASAIPEEDELRVAVAAYNQGFAGAYDDYRDHGDPDRGTTGGNYSQDVLDRRSQIGAARRLWGWT